LDLQPTAEAAVRSFFDFFATASAIKLTDDQRSKLAARCWLDAEALKQTGMGSYAALAKAVADKTVQLRRVRAQLGGG
jgi:phosphopantetheinyl transferase